MTDGRSDSTLDGSPDCAAIGGGGVVTGTITGSRVCVPKRRSLGVIDEVSYRVFDLLPSDGTCDRKTGGSLDVSTKVSRREGDLE
jgi:hypothetical protein